jgi:V/A-type H+-transporting ATPase subunit B
MRAGVTPAHVDLAAQVLAGLARARQARELVELAGECALGDTDRSYLALERCFRDEVTDPAFVRVPAVLETIGRVWQAWPRCRAGN